VAQAKTSTDLVQRFVDESFSQFDLTFDRANVLTDDVLEYYEKKPELGKKLNSPMKLALTTEEINVVASQHVVGQMYSLINSLKEKITEEQNDELVDAGYDDMASVRSYFSHRIA